MKWKNLRMPDEIVWDREAMTGVYGKLVAEPLERGYGVTIGNSLRRVLLSSLQGAAAIGVKIDDVLHEFSVVNGVTEDVAELILNVKQLNLRLHSDGPERLVLHVESEGEVKASDFESNPNVEIMNPDLHMATLGEDARLHMEVIVGAGRGYVQAEDHVFEEKPIGFVPIDSVFSPVKRVNYEVENTRVGQRTDYDKLTVEVWTNGAVSPEDAVSFASKLLKDHLLLFMAFDEEPQEEEEEVLDEEQLRLMELLNHSVDELELSVRSSNCLRDAGIKTLGDLVRKTESEMLKYRNFGRKSLQELVDILADMGLSFGMDVDALLEPGRGKEDDDQKGEGESFEEMLGRMSGAEESEEEAGAEEGPESDEDEESEEDTLEDEGDEEDRQS
ncbi:MAG: DNA-directed RNA polymerase subunit alpha [Candidatus Eisenbacteria bacterium]|nr:DNA-directed RNA polymerase subunit alpha [Candidatus Eisenbacteria bacterium]